MASNAFVMAAPEAQSLSDDMAPEAEACMDEDSVTPVEQVSKKDMQRSRKMAMPPPARSAAPPPPPSPAPMSAPGARPMPQRAMAVAKGAPVGGMARLEESAAHGFGGGAAPAEPMPEPEIDADSWLDFDSLALPGSESGRRGRLTRASGVDRRPLLAQANSQIEYASAPGQALDPLQSRGEFDHRFDAEGPVDVPSNGLPHRVMLRVASAPIRQRFRCVPREGDEVYREAVLTNPFSAPLLGGPLDVFMDGALLSTSPVAPVGRGGPLTLGLGVEERLRVARNARAEESSKGVLGGTASIEHQVDVEVASALGREIDLEILERLPVTDDKDVKVTALEARPAGEAYDQTERGAPLRGGMCFKLKVPAGGKATLSFGYRVELPSKMEIVGGNRRE